MKFLFCIFTFSILIALFTFANAAEKLDPGVRQLVITLAEDWDSDRGRMILLEKGDGRRATWRLVLTDPVPVLLGRNGLAWGLGVLTGGNAETKADGWKREGDGKAPAGVFALPKVFGYSAVLPEGSRGIPYHQVTERDAWVDDPANPFYNRHVVLDPRKGAPSWFESQRMRLGDDAYTWLIEVRHNADPPQRGFGSAIFLHTRRGPDRTTAGCTTMQREHLVRLVRWLDPEAKPHYVLLPVGEYLKRSATWGLPDLGILKRTAPSSRP